MPHRRLPAESARLRRWLPYAYALLPLVAAVLLIAAMWAALAFTLEHNRAATRVAAERSAGNLAQAFEGHVLRTIKHVDHALLTLRRQWLALGTQRFIVELESLQREVYQDDLLLQIAVIGPNGQLLLSNLQRQLERVDLSDREHYVVQRDASEDRLFISKPILGRVSGQRTLNFTRRIVAADGSFAGVLVASVEAEYFARFFASIDVGERGAITLLGLDRVIRARAGTDGGASRNGLDAGAVGQQVPHGRPYLLGAG